MSDQVFLVERESPDDSGCGRPRENVLDKISYLAMGFVLVGLVFAAIGFLYPRDIQRDPNASARENETVDEEFMRLTEALNAIIITGMILIGLGGLILSAIFTNSVVCAECHSNRRQNDDVGTRTLSSEPMASQQSGPAARIVDNNSQNYGTVSADLPR